MLVIFIPFDRSSYGTMTLTVFILVLTLVKHLIIDDVIYRIRLITARIRFARGRGVSIGKLCCMAHKDADLQEPKDKSSCCCCRRSKKDQSDKSKVVPIVDEELPQLEVENESPRLLAEVAPPRRTKTSNRVRKPWHAVQAISEEESAASNERGPPNPKLLNATQAADVTEPLETNSILVSEGDQTKKVSPLPVLKHAKSRGTQGSYSSDDQSPKRNVHYIRYKQQQSENTNNLII